MTRGWLALAAGPWLLAAAEPTLVPDVSQARIDIVYSFTGADLLAFGAILYPGGHAPPRPADVVVVVKGPPQAITVREKAKVAGIWVNHDAARFRSVPSFYAVASGRAIDRIVSPRTAAIYELGADRLLLSPAGGPGGAGLSRFERGLVDLKQRAGLFAEHADAVSLRAGVLYRAAVPIPARVPVGAYTVETFLIQDGRVVAAATRTVSIDKSGFERFVAASAERQPVLYGLAAVTLSLLLGWAASALFRRRGN